LQLQLPKVVRLSPYRPNLFLMVRRVVAPAQRQAQLEGFIRERPREAGLVYVRSRDTAETLTRVLQKKGFTTAYYHAGLFSEQRRQLERDWLSKGVPFLICTSAFGMGINHNDLRWIVHYQMPLAAEEYLQEIGRAGRDGKPATALLLASEPTGLLDPSDKNLQTYFLQNRQRQQKQALAQGKNLPAPGVVTELTDPALAPTLGYLDQAGMLEWVGPFHFRLKQTPPPRLTLPTSDTLPAMQRYPHIQGCRWDFLLQAMGTPSQGACGHCDSCQGRKR
jgi:ATP-dependent DNA helicase RecQ